MSHKSQTDVSGTTARNVVPLQGHSMKETTTDIFEKLKRSKPLITKEKSVQAVFFQLNFDADGAHLCVINEKGKQISPGHEYFAGPTRAEIHRKHQKAEQFSDRLE